MNKFIGSFLVCCILAVGVACSFSPPMDNTTVSAWISDTSFDGQRYKRGGDFYDECRGVIEVTPGVENDIEGYVGHQIIISWNGKLIGQDENQNLIYEKIQHSSEIKQIAGDHVDFEFEPKKVTNQDGTFEFSLDQVFSDIAIFNDDRIYQGQAQLYEIYRYDNSFPPMAWFPIGDPERVCVHVKHYQEEGEPDDGLGGGDGD